MFWLILLLALLIYLGYLLANWWMRRKAASVIPADQFGQDLRHVQLIDLREKDEFRRAHILGARNIPYPQFKQRMTELRKDQPVYLYESGVLLAGRAAHALKKAGYPKAVILKDGFEAWTGKIKVDKIQE